MKLEWSAALVLGVVVGCSDANELEPVGEADASTSNGFADATSSSEEDGGEADAGSLPGLDRFSFFVTSLQALRELSGSQNGFGGDLSYGETGAGAGLRGADKLCAAIAERSMPGASAKPWRAF